MTQTIEQLTARVRELEEENARLKAVAESVAKHYESMLEKAKRFDAWKANPYTAVLEKYIAELNNNLDTTTALTKIIEKVERRTIERCAKKLLSIGALGDGDFLAAIRTLPVGQIKLEELL